MSAERLARRRDEPVAPGCLTLEIRRLGFDASPRHLNPVKVLAAGEGVTVVDARILAAPSAPAALSAPARAAVR